MDPLITPAELAVYPWGKQLTTEEAALLCELVSGLIRDYCEWHIAPSVTEDVRVDGSGTWVQDLPTLHLTALASVTEDGTMLDVAGVEWSERGQLLKPFGAVWTCRYRGVTVSMTHGYAMVPAAVQAVALGVLARATSADPGVAGRTVGGITVTYPTGQRATAGQVQTGTVYLTDVEHAVLDKYVVPHRPG